MNSQVPDARLLIFDWDGTLMDSISKIITCFHLAFKEAGLKRAPDAHIKSLIGLPLNVGIRTLVPGISDAELERLVSIYRDVWRHGGIEAQLFPNVTPMLERFVNEGYLLAIATGKGREGLERELDQAGIACMFKATRTANDTKPKPDPAMVFELLDECGVMADEALIIGDTDFDLEMANNAGVAAVGVLSGGHDKDRLAACQPRALLPTAADLPAWFDGLTQGEPVKPAAGC